MTKFKQNLFFLLSILFLAGCEKEKDPLKRPVANAGPTKVVQLPTKTVQLRGDGEVSNTPITGYLWSLISGPSVPEIVSESSASTAINKLVAGTYIFQFAVIDNAGLTGVDTVSVVVNPAEEKTITLNPSSNPLEGHVDSYNVTGGGGDTELEIGSWTIFGNSANWRSYLSFDQSAIPTGSTIVNATLYLYAMPEPHSANTSAAMNGSTNSMYVERITAAWSVSGLSFASLPPTTTTNRVSVPQTNSNFEDATIDVTSLVQDMQTKGNFGFGLKLQNESVYNFRAYASSFYSNVEKHPKLVITYQ